MKYVIDLPDDCDCSWVGVDVPMGIKSDGTIYKRFSVSLEPYKPEPEPKVFEVGDEVINSDGEEGCVLVPDCENNLFVVLMKGYAFPQLQRKRDWKKKNYISDTIRKYVKFAYDALNEVSE